MNKRNTIIRNIALGFAGLVLLVIILALPAIINYVRYYVPDTTLPAGRMGVSQAFEGNKAPEAFSSTAKDLTNKYIEEADLPGVSIALSYGNDLIWISSHGFADLNTNIPVGIDSRFRIGSTSKALTVVLLGRLVDQNRIDLDEPIGKYIHNLAHPLRNITFRQLASHTAGIRHYHATDFNIYTGNTWTTGSDGLDIFARDPLLFEPGTNFSYSTYGYTLLSVALANAFNTDFLTLLEQELYEPVGMASTSGDLPDSDIPDRVGFYVTADGQYTEAAPQNVSYKWAGGGIVSSAHDLVKLGQALLSDMLLSDVMKRTMWTPVLLPGGAPNPQNYALGWRHDVSTQLLGEDQPTSILHHGGIQVGGASFYAIIPDYEITVAVLTNTGSLEARRTVQSLAYELVRLAINNSVSSNATNR